MWALAALKSPTKQQSGKDIYVSGGASLEKSLLELGLIDKLNLFVHPGILKPQKK
ncbi:dihydrofolate reductase family protein [Shimazuella alba]|uniref:Bacterial bifunctional deaminase-reductase C-terminal domain-containing protein n=1 Tax=Shimazuella alba TaxID=2690964 RepID=A0A6I4W580_9BACL|nr:hypothetical protein [Shimazuella alba]